MLAEAIAHPNIALIKYWGKRDPALNLPAVGSLSVTLDRLRARTRVEFDPALPADQLQLNDQPAGSDPKVSRCLDRIRRIAGSNYYARVSSQNNFPTAAGLASSAAGFAALAVAADAALNTRLTQTRLSELARLGSGSASRSLFGGFVSWHLGSAGDGGDSVAEPLFPPEHWPLQVVIGITSTTAKAIGSTEGMERSRRTSPYYNAWAAGQAQDLKAAWEAVAERDFQRLAELSEFSCLKMHAVAMSSQPGLLYWNGATLEAIHAIRSLRQQGSGVFFTVDAGPQIKAVCLPDAVVQVKQLLQSISGITAIHTCGLGPGAHTVAAG